MKRRKLMSVLLALTMLLSLLQTTALAAEPTPVTTDDPAQAVAQIGETYYISLDTAVTEVPADGTIKLLKDVTLSSTLTISKKLTLDGDGKTITADNAFTGDMILVNANGEATLKNLTLDGAGKAAYGVQFYTAKGSLENITAKNTTKPGVHINASIVTATGTLTFVDTGWGGLLNVGWGNAISAEAADCSFDFSGATLSGVSTVYSGSEDIQRATAASKTITITAPTGWAESQAEGSVLYAPAVARIGNDYYATLAGAVYYAANDTEITLLSDVALTESIDINKKVTIDLNGKNITFTEQKKRFEVDGGTLNLIGSGMVKEQNPYYAPVHIRGSNDPNAAYNTVVKVGKDVKLQGWAGIMIDKNSVQSHTKAYGVEVIVDGELIGVNDTGGDSGSGIYINGQVKETTGNVPKITLNSTSKVSGTGYSIYAAGYAQWTIAGTVSGEGGMEAKAGTFAINGGSITATAESTTHVRDDDGASTTGYAIAAVDNAGYAGNPTITITNGNVTGAVAVVDDDADPNNDRATISVQGGTFSADPSAYVVSGDTHIVRYDSATSYTVVANSGLTSGTYLTEPNVADGYVATESNGKWTVALAPTPNPTPDPDPDPDPTPVGGGSSSSSTTVTVPISSDTGSVNVKAEVSKTGTATVEISDKQIEQIAANGSGTVTVDVSKLEKVESVQVPAHVVDTTNKASDTGLTVALPAGSVALDETALESVATGKDITVSVQQVPATDLTEEQQKAVGDMANIGLVVDVELFVGREKQSSFNGGKLTISVPYTPKRGEDTSKLTVWFIRDDGSIENKGGYYDAAKGCFVFETEHLSRYVLVSVNEQFSDVAADAYYAAAVNWAVSRNITNGIGDGKFGPDLGCTRGQIVTFLYRCAVAQGVDVSIGESTNILSYTDALEVPEFAFEAFQWAVGAGIVNGADGKLMPNDDCTRGQIVTMLYRYAVSTGKDVSVGEDTNILSYADFATVPEFAIAPFQWACGAGIIQGADGKLMPNDTCTRGQIVTMLYRANG